MGGIKVPKFGTAAASLAELNAEHATEPVGMETTPQVEPPTEPDTHLRTYADTQISKSVDEQKSTQGSNYLSAQVSTYSSDTPLEDVIRERLQQRRRHTSGKRSSVDTPAELDLRMKRYALDKGGLSVRDMFLEAIIGYLEKEGY